MQKTPIFRTTCITANEPCKSLQSDQHQHSQKIHIEKPWGRECGRGEERVRDGIIKIVIIVEYQVMNNRHQENKMTPKYKHNITYNFGNNMKGVGCLVDPDASRLYTSII